jgi:hypothetical protein
VVIRFTVVSVLMLTSNTLGADDSHDGNWWRRQLPVLRSAYIVGMMDGSVLGTSLMRDPAKASSQPQLYQAQGEIDLARRLSEFFLNMTAGQLVDGMDKFYEDFPNRSIPVGFAIEVIVRDIKGVTKTEIEELTLKLRQEAQVIK